MRTPAPAFRSPRVARLSPLAAGIALAFSPAALGISIVVTTGADVVDPDDGVVSLREAIMDANAACNTNVSNIPTITFSGPFTIAPSSPLPAFSCGLLPYFPTVDGGGTVLATGYDPNVTLLGPGNASFNDCGLRYDYNTSYGGTLTVKGMKIQNFTYGSFGKGVCSNGPVNVFENHFSGNTFGVRVDHYSTALSSQIGSFSYGGNIFTGNDEGAFIQFGNATVENNRFGTNNGTSAAANDTGLRVANTGSVGIYNNVISGNQVGVSVNSVSSVAFEGNYIGLNADGDGKLANTAGGVLVSNASEVSFDGDYIAGNGVVGINFEVSNSLYVWDTTIGEGVGGENIPNAVGLDAFCSGYIGIEDSFIKHNTGDGVKATGVDTVFLSDNLIHENGGMGVRVSAGSCDYGGTFSFVAIQDNEVSDNGGAGVFVGTDGYTEIGGGSIFGNAGTNLITPNKITPVINSVVQNGDDLTTDITFTVTGPVEANVHVQFYANSAMGKPAGEFFIGDTFVFLDTSPKTTTFTIGGAPALSKAGVQAFTLLPDNISATVEDAGCCSGHTSEFSTMKAATTAPQLLIGPNPLNFTPIEVDTTSPAKTITLRQVGDQDLVIDYIGTDPFCYGGPICYGGSFICSTTCSTGTPYATGQACSISAQFAPTFIGLHSQSIYVCSNGIGSPQTITLNGEAVAPPPLVLSPTDWDFGDVAVGAMSATKNFTLTSRYAYGGLPATVATVGDFDIVSNTCPSIIPASGSCYIGVAFGPTGSGSATGQLTVTIPPLGDATVNALGAQGFTLGSPVARAILRGNGLAGGTLQLPENILVGAAIVGGDGITQTYTIVNNGTAAVAIASLTISEGFTLEHNCPPSLEPGASCQLIVGFTAETVGEFTGTLTVVSSAVSTGIPVTALGQVSAAALLRVTPITMGFGSRMIASPSATQGVAIQNVGSAPAVNFSLATSTVDFLVASNSCGPVLAAGATCSASVGFRPLGFGSRFGNLVVTSSAINSPSVVTLGGTGCRPFIASSRFGSGPSCAP